MGELRYLPLKPRSKEPRDKGWEKNNYTHEDLDGFNVGMIIDQTMIDVDLDWPEARAVTKRMIEPDTRSWGRNGEITHLVYRGDLPKSINFELPKVQGAPALTGAHGNMVLQLRTSAEGEGCYAMIPPSTHPDGDKLEWINDASPTETDADRVLEIFGPVAALAALARFYPATGGRDDAMLSLVGCAVRADWDQQRIENFITTLCHIAGDTNEIQMRLRKAANTIKRKEGGRKVRGIPGAARSLGIPVEWMRKIAVWVGWAREAPEGSEPAVFVSGVVRDVSKQAWQILADYEVDGDPGVYQFGEALARVDRGRHQLLNSSTLKNDLNRCAVWVKMDNGKPKNTSAPASCVEDMLSARASEVTVPELKRVATVPMFTRNGRLLNQRGFDEDSGIFLDLEVHVDVPHEPTSRDVRQAIKTLWYPISDFPFEHKSDRVHALAMMLEPYMRDMFGPTSRKYQTRLQGSTTPRARSSASSSRCCS